MRLFFQVMVGWIAIDLIFVILWAFAMDRGRGWAMGDEEKPYVCPQVDEFECSQCSGHNRCEDEMEAGFGEYEAPDVDR